MNHWIRPSCDSRTGASHLRRGAPCQDASGYLACHDAEGLPIQVLVVSDGHGGSRYVRSDVGARLACEVAMREVAQALSAARVGAPGALEEWRAWLAVELPARIVAAWRREVECHWRADPAAAATPFTPLVYGATLGVLLLTPAWWAHTGLGDWDLVRIETDGGDALLSEEPERHAGGEATYSLCLERAECHFAPRTALHPLTAELPPFALLLCTDGVRKSCGSDADFLTLARYLAGLHPPGGPSGGAELAQALDHISAHGSGDDVSVVVARWAPLPQAPAWPAAGCSEPVHLVQPALALAAQPLAAMAAGESGVAHTARWAEQAAPLPAVGPSTLPRDRRGPGVRVLTAAAGLLGLGGSGLLIARHFGLGPSAVQREPAPPLLTLQQRRDLERQVGALCSPNASPSAERHRSAADAAPGGPTAGGEAAGGPAHRGDAPLGPASRPALPPPVRTTTSPVAVGSAGSAVAPSPALQGALAPGIATSDPQRLQHITATLAPRASVFHRLATGDATQVKALLAQSQGDPLNALIAYSSTDTSLRPAAAPAQRPLWWHGLRGRLAALLPMASESGGTSVAPASPLAALGACPELNQALRAGWQRHQAAGAAAPSVGSQASVALPAAQPLSGSLPPTALGEERGLSRGGPAQRRAIPSR